MKEQVKITKDELIKKIARQTKCVSRDVEKFYNALENIIYDSLRCTNENQDVCIKLFNGISLKGIYVSEKSKKNNLTNEINFVDSKIKPKFNITRYYCEKLNKE